MLNIVHYTICTFSTLLQNYTGFFGVFFLLKCLILESNRECTNVLLNKQEITSDKKITDRCIIYVHCWKNVICICTCTLLEKCNIYLYMYIVRKCNIYLYMYIVRKCNIYLYMYIVGKCNIYLYNLYKQVEKGAFDQLFLPVLQRVQMNFIFTDNLHYYNYTCIVLILQVLTS